MAKVEFSAPRHITRRFFWQTPRSELIRQQIQGLSSTDAEYAKVPVIEREHRVDLLAFREIDQCSVRKLRFLVVVLLKKIGKPRHRGSVEW